ncbi:F0F1 ATP synthase subunit B [Candidatus Microgenomates bacterium]|nr:F0F1 ATP synthase subunit B [Candidatus Microgenomates bacterium]
MDALGINPVLLIAQLISFSVLVFVLNRFLYKKIQQSLESRREMVKKTIAHEAETEKRLKALEEERQELHKKNQADVKTLLAQAKKEAEELKKDVLAQTDEKAKRLIENAKITIDQEKTKAENELRTQATILAKEMAKKVIADKVSDKSWQEKELKEGLTKLKNV